MKLKGCLTALRFKAFTSSGCFEVILISFVISCTLQGIGFDNRSTDFLLFNVYCFYILCSKHTFIRIISLISLNLEAENKNQLPY